MNRPDFESFREKALEKKGVRRAYEELDLAYRLRRQLIALRKEAGMTQEELAELLHTRKSNISRLENVHSTASPRLATIEAYARAMGYKVEIRFSSC